MPQSDDLKQSPDWWDENISEMLLWAGFGFSELCQDTPETVGPAPDLHSEFPADGARP